MTKLLEKISSILFSSNDEPSFAVMQDKRRRPLEILEGISFDGENYQRVYVELLEFLEAKVGGFSAHEKDLLKSIIDAVTCDEEENTPLGMKTTSILKKKRNNVAQKLKASYPPIPYLIRPHTISEVSTKPEEPPLAEHKPIERKEYVLRDNGRRAKVFSARFDEDYEEVMAPPEPIQVEKLPFTSKPVEVPRIASSFSQESEYSLSHMEKKALLEEAQIALELEKKSLEASQKPLPVIETAPQHQGQLGQSSKLTSQGTQLSDSQSSFEIGSLGSKPMTLETIASPEPPKSLFHTYDMPKQVTVKPLAVTDDKRPFSFSFPPSESKEDKKPLFTFPKEDKQETKPTLTFSIPPTSCSKQEGSDEPSDKKVFERPEKKADEDIKPDGFTFNLSKPSSESQSVFKFGEPSASDFDKTQPILGNTTEKPKTDVAPAFSFNAKPSESLTVSLGRRQEEKPPAFSFSQPTNSSSFFPSTTGAPTASNITTPTFNFGKSQEGKPSFAFSQPSTSEPAKPSLFTASQSLAESSGAATAKPLFSFSQPLSPVDSSMEAEVPVTSTSQPEAPKTFIFGQGSSSQSSVFTFGSTQTPSQSFVFGNNQSASQPQSQPFSFNFGAKPLSTQQAPFAFGASANQTTPSYNFGASSLSNSQPQFIFAGNKMQNDGPAPSSPQSTLSSSSATTSGRLISRPILKRNR